MSAEMFIQDAKIKANFWDESFLEKFNHILKSDFAHCSLSIGPDRSEQTV